MLKKAIEKAIGGCVLAISVACASSPVDSERLAASEAAIRAAREMGAEKVPPAQLHLQLAKEQEEQAKKLLKDGDKKRADVLLIRSQADAELALALAREAPARAEAQRALDRVKQLEQSAQQ
jgi:hypothetical protein